jgi:hypothetical protein
VRIRTLPYAAGTAAAAIGATLLLSGSASAAPAGDDRDPGPPGPTFTVCSFEGAPSPGTMSIKPRGDWRPARPATPREPEVHCEEGGPVSGTCAVVVPDRPTGPGGGDVMVPALPAEPGAGVERADGPGQRVELTCEGAGVVQRAPRR